jgi:hypothetical protein
MYRFHYVSETRTFHYIELYVVIEGIYVITHFYAGNVYVMYYFTTITSVMMS